MLYLILVSDLSPINTSMPLTVPIDFSTIFSMSFRFLSLTLKLQVSLIFLSDSRICSAISKGETLGIPSTESVRWIPLHTELIVSILSNRTFLIPLAYHQKFLAGLFHI